MRTTDRSNGETSGEGKNPESIPAHSSPSSPSPSSATGDNGDEPDRYLTTEQVAGLFQLSPRTLKNYRQRGGGPTFVTLGRLVRYRLSDVQEWARAQRRDITTPGE